MEKLNMKILSIRLMNIRAVGNIQGNLEFTKDKITFLEQVPFRKGVTFYLVEYKFRNDNIPLLLELTLGILIEKTSDTNEKEVQNHLLTIFTDEFNKTIQFLKSIENIEENDI